MHAAILPLTDPVLLLAAVLPVVFLVPLLSERLKIPGVVGLILAGIVVGPHGLGLFERGGLIGSLSEAGLLYVMFIAGAEIDLVMFSKYRQQSVVFGTAAFGLPLLGGTAVGLWVGWSWLPSILMGAVLASHTLIAYPLATRLGLGKSLPVTAAVGGTILTDVLALLVLAIVADAARGNFSWVHALQMAVALGLFASTVLVLVPRVGRTFFRNVGSRRDSEFMFILSVLFGAAALAQVAGVQPIIGAFLAGLALNRFLPEHSPLLGRLKFVGSTLFFPFFLLATGMLVDPGILLDDRSLWLLSGALLAVVVFTKFWAVWYCGRLFEFSLAERLVMLGLTLPQAAATLAATTVGYQLHLFSLPTVNAIVLIILLTCLAGPLLVGRAGRAVIRKSGQLGGGIGRRPQRVLVPVANPSTALSLLELASVLRGHGEPIFGLTVVPGEGSRRSAAVAAAEEILSAAIGDGPSGCHALTRVSTHVPTAVATAAVETRSATLILGWNGKRSLSRWVFGSVIDQVLEQAAPLIAVARLNAPLVSFDRLVVVLAPLVGVHAEFAAITRALAALGKAIGCVTVWAVGPDAVPDALTRVATDVAVERVPDWKALAWLLSTSAAGDLVAVVSARRGAPAWSPVLEKLPGLLAEPRTRSFVVLYPPELDREGAVAAPSDPALEPATAVPSP